MKKPEIRSLDRSPYIVNGEVVPFPAAMTVFSRMRRDPEFRKYITQAEQATV